MRSIPIGVSGEVRVSNALSSPNAPKGDSRPGWLDVLRRTRKVSAVQVLMMATCKEEVDLAIGLEVGADDHLPIPFGMRELLQRIEKIQAINERLSGL